MAVNGEFSGMAEMIAALKALPEALQREAEGVVVAAAEQTANEVRSAYLKANKSYFQHGRVRENAGNLVAGVVVRRSKGESGRRLRAQVKSSAPHAHLYEYGTVSRHLQSNGANRGTMPATPTVVPIAQRNRSRMVAALTDVVKRSKVTGFDGTPEVR